MDLAEKIAKLVTLAEHPKTGAAEKAAAQRMLERLRAKAETEGLNTRQSKTWSKYYQLPEIQHGSKHDLVKGLGAKEITALIRADIALARKLGKQKAKAGGVAIADPIADAPACIRFFVNFKYDGYTPRITVLLKGVPADWWERKPYEHVPNETHMVPGPRLKALRNALAELTWQYNYDGSDPMVDHFNRGFYDRYRADGHGESSFPQNI